MISSADPASTELPAIEVGDTGFAIGWLHTARATLFAPRRFYRTLAPGSVRVAYAFAVTNLVLLFVAIELVSWLDNSQAHDLSVYSLLRVVVGPLLGAGLLMGVLGVVWSGVARVFGARVPFNVSTRAAAYLSVIAPSFGLIMVLSGTAPEAAIPVITWYASMFGSYLFLTYATFSLARRDTHSVVKAGIQTWVFQLACLVVAGVLMALYTALQG